MSAQVRGRKPASKLWNFSVILDPTKTLPESYQV